MNKSENEKLYAHMVNENLHMSDPGLVEAFTAPAGRHLIRRGVAVLGACEGPPIASQAMTPPGRSLLTDLVRSRL